MDDKNRFFEHDHETVAFAFRFPEILCPRRQNRKTRTNTELYSVSMRVSLSPPMAEDEISACLDFITLLLPNYYLIVTLLFIGLWSYFTLI
jgi:hypothetical protein